MPNLPGLNLTRNERFDVSTANLLQPVDDILNNPHATNTLKYDYIMHAAASLRQINPDVSAQLTELSAQYAPTQNIES